MQYTKERLDITSLIFEQVNQICSVIDMNSTNGKKVTVIDDLTFNQGARGSNPRWLTKRDKQAETSLFVSFYSTNK